MLTFLRKVIGFVAHPTHSRTMGLVVMLILLAAVSLTVIVSQQQQQLRQRAAGTDDPQNVCPSIDSMPTCASNNPADNPCEEGKKEGDKCRTGNTIYECQKQ